MQFNSYIFILMFIPIVFLLYYSFPNAGKAYGKIVLIIASAVFYLYPVPALGMTLCCSILLNYLFACLQKVYSEAGKPLLVVPIIINIGVLFYFKYTNFAISIWNSWFHGHIEVGNIILPLGISFFTFQQISYLKAIYEKRINHSLVDYLVFILYFPKLLMGPLIEPDLFLKQVNSDNVRQPDVERIASGIKVFCFGIFKKVILADTFAQGVAWGFQNVEIVSAMEWSMIMFAYTFEIYFDFSGYCDMAMGISRMFNIELPINFNSPYKAVSIRDFWKRWHITLTRFLTDYIYIPLGGNRRRNVRTMLNVMAVFAISGLWHGANWTFILWGILHGAISVVERLTSHIENKIFLSLRRIITFLTINILWLLFRAESVSQWGKILQTVFTEQRIELKTEFLTKFYNQELAIILNLLPLGRDLLGRGSVLWLILFLGIGAGVCFIAKNNYENQKKLTPANLCLAVISFLWSLIYLSKESVFIYNGF